jgi:hypothetical protein
MKINPKKKVLMQHALHVTDYKGRSLCEAFNRYSHSVGNPRCPGLKCNECDRMFRHVIKLGIEKFNEEK